jgi:hypothetical protein
MRNTFLLLMDNQWINQEFAACRKFSIQLSPLYSQTRNNYSTSKRFVFLSFSLTFLSSLENPPSPKGKLISSQSPDII